MLWRYWRRERYSALANSLVCDRPGLSQCPSLRTTQPVTRVTEPSRGSDRIKEAPFSRDARTAISFSRCLMPEITVHFFVIWRKAMRYLIEVTDDTGHSAQKIYFIIHRVSRF